MQLRLVTVGGGHWVIACVMLFFGCSDRDGAPVDAADHSSVCESLEVRDACLEPPDEACLGATADVVFEAELSERHSMTFAVPYGQTDCPGRVVVDLVPNLAADGAWLSAMWDAAVATEASCAEVGLFVWVYRRASGGRWEAWDSYQTLGSWDSERWQPGACVTTLCNGGKLRDGSTNEHLGFPYSWVSASPDTQLRVFLAATTGTCEQAPVRLMFADEP